MNIFRYIRASDVDRSEHSDVDNDYVHLPTEQRQIQTKTTAYKDRQLVNSSDDCRSNPDTDKTNGNVTTPKRKKNRGAQVENDRRWLYIDRQQLDDCHRNLTTPAKRDRFKCESAASDGNEDDRQREDDDIEDRDDDDDPYDFRLDDTEIPQENDGVANNDDDFVLLDDNSTSEVFDTSKVYSLRRRSVSGSAPTMKTSADNEEAVQQFSTQLQSSAPPDERQPRENLHRYCRSSDAFLYVEEDNGENCENCYQTRPLTNRLLDENVGKSAEIKTPSWFKKNQQQETLQQPPAEPFSFTPYQFQEDVSTISDDNLPPYDDIGEGFLHKKRSKRQNKKKTAIKTRDNGSVAYERSGKQVPYDKSFKVNKRSAKQKKDGTKQSHKEDIINLSCTVIESTAPRYCNKSVGSTKMAAVNDDQRPSVGKHGHLVYRYDGKFGNLGIIYPAETKSKPITLIAGSRDARDQCSGACTASNSILANVDVEVPNLPPKHCEPQESIYGKNALLSRDCRKIYVNDRRKARWTSPESQVCGWTGGGWCNGAQQKYMLTPSLGEPGSESLHPTQQVPSRQKLTTTTAEVPACVIRPIRHHSYTHAWNQVGLPAAYHQSTTTPSLMAGQLRSRAPPPLMTSLKNYWKKTMSSTNSTLNRLGEVISENKDSIYLALSFFHFGFMTAVLILLLCGPCDNGGTAEAEEQCSCLQQQLQEKTTEDVSPASKQFGILLDFVHRATETLETFASNTLKGLFGP